MNKKPALIAALVTIMMLTVLPLAGNGVGGVQTAEAAAPYFSKPAFQRVWLTTDSLVDNGAVSRSFLWGNYIDAGYERYDDAAPIGGQRRWVQYFDKTRMELNNPYGDPNSQYYVSNGLLVVELVSGRRQEGDNRFVDTSNPANNVPVAGDNLAINGDAPTYKTLRVVASYDDASVAANHKANLSGQAVTATLTKNADGSGVVGNNPAMASLAGVNNVYYDGTFGHNVPKVFWDYMNQTGPTFDFGSRTTVNGQKVFDWQYAMGYPIMDPYWTKVKVAGVVQDVMMQCFQRRCLTYTPANPAAYQVEMGNVGQHYFVWRYGANAKMPSSSPINDPILSPLKLPNLSYGINAFLYYQNLDQEKSWLNDLGARWVRVQVRWDEVEDTTRTDDNRFNWTEIDKFINMLYLNNDHILVSVVAAPAAYTVGGSGLPAPDKVSKFTAFMYALATHYKGKVDAYEVWNEENLERESGTGIDPKRYITMLEKAYPTIKQADPSALVVFGALSQTNTNDANVALPDTDFLKAVYAYNGGEVRAYFDVLGMHASGWTNPPDTLWPDKPGPGPGFTTSAEFYFRRIEQERQIMADAGDGAKQVWLTEFGWSSDQNPPAGFEYAEQNTEQQQATYIQQAYQQAQANYPWIGAMFLWNLDYSLKSVPNSVLPNGKNSDNVGFSILRSDGSERPAYNAFKIMAHTAK